MGSIQGESCKIEGVLGIRPMGSSFDAQVRVNSFQGKENT